MTVGTVCLALSELERLLVILDASPETKAVRALVAFLTPHSEAKTVAFLKKASPTRGVGPSQTGRKVGDLLPMIAAYNAILGKLASKTGKEFSIFLEFLQRFEHADLDDLISAAQGALTAPLPAKRKSASPPPDEQLVAEYVQQLASVIGRDEGFSRIFGPLKRDKRARAQEVIEIAKRMMPAPPSGMDRKKALAAIQNLHLAAKGFDLKLRASRGRSAA